jgi:hypothetical protein
MNNHHDRAKRISKLWIVVVAVSLVALVTVSLESSKATAQPEPEILVREFVAAFNARNIDAMLAAVDENIQWLSISEAKVSIEAEGKNALRESMERYFRSCPSCKSSLEQIQKSGSRVTAMERARWSGKNGLKSQAGLSVYEFRNGKILRVYYFPADVDGPSPAVNK